MLTSEHCGTASAFFLALFSLATDQHHVAEYKNIVVEGKNIVLGPPRGFVEEENMAIKWETGEQRQSILGKETREHKPF